MASFLGSETLFQEIPKACRRYILDIEEWEQLVESSRSLRQLKRTWSQISRIEARLKRVELANTLLRAFGRRGSVKHALLVFDSIVVKNSESWTLVLSGMAFSRCFVGSGFKGSLEDARKRFDSSDKSQECWNTLLTAYAQGGHLLEGKQFFDQMPVRDRVSWSSLLAAAASNGEVEDAIDVFERMPLWGENCRSAMLAAYAMNGDMQNARKMFKSMPVRGTLDWNMLMTLYCSASGIERGIPIFRLMALDGVNPDELTFVCLLLGCPALDAGRRCFWRMIRDYGLKPMRLHYSCIVDLVHRAGYIKEHVKKLIRSLPRDRSWASSIAAGETPTPTYLLADRTRSSRPRARRRLIAGRDGGNQRKHEKACLQNKRSQSRKHKPTFLS